MAHSSRFREDAEEGLGLLSSGIGVRPQVGECLRFRFLVGRRGSWDADTIVSRSHDVARARPHKISSINNQCTLPVPAA